MGEGLVLVGEPGVRRTFPDLPDGLIGTLRDEGDCLMKIVNLSRLGT